MRNGFLLLALALLLAAPASASAAKRPVLAIGDQKADMFSDPRLDWLGIRHARLVVPWYIESGGSPDERAQVRLWLETARREGIQPLVGFGHGWIGWTRIYLPKRREFARAFRAFRRAYPWVRHYITWNEANHCSQPTCTKPRRTARFFDTIVRQCPRCRVVAAAVLAAPNMATWIKRFRRAARHRPKLWGLHNYGDVNRLRWSGTREFLRLVRGPVWLTETGGVVWRNKYGGQDPFPVGTKRARKVTRYLLRKSRRHRRRIKRVYLYHWNVDRPRPQWDSGIIDWAGRARGAFAVVAR
ncbi:MAG TPA: glycosyl hydrolase, partial [Solirubrobacteraceae bacterium]|nr:glycosyl hydrolase [Solirubrobacteraceae bacterium]